MQIPKSLYDALKYLAQVVLPAVATLYYTIAQIWGLPNAPEVVGTITGVDAFLGVLLQLSSSAYNKGDARFDGSIDVSGPPGGTKTFSLTLNSDPSQLDQKSEILFKVNPTP